MDLKEAELLGADATTHWYYVAKGRALRTLLGSAPAERVLDVGAGTGVFSRQLLDAGIARSAVCVDTGYDREWSEVQNGRTIQFVREVKDVRADLVLMMDVLEHVSDDGSLLSRYTESLPAGARVAITVPAFQFLWSGHDIFLEHHRRYTLDAVESLVRRADLRRISSGYFFGALFPAVAAMRLWRRVTPGRELVPRSEMKRYPPWLNAALVAVHDIERHVMFPRNRVGGLTAFCLAQR